MRAPRRAHAGAGPALLALALALAPLGGCGGTASAPRAAPAAPPAAPPLAATVATSAAPVAFGLSGDSPDGRVHARVAPGGRAELAFRLANAGGAPTTFALTPTHRLPGPGFRLAEPSAAPERVGAWLSATPTVSVPARESARVSAELSVPAGTPPGRYQGALAAAPSAGAPAGAGTVASVTYRVAARVTVTVAPEGG